ncbi:hypothetical protein DV735_g3916, partial [Chaetothyriales sp. CBS 134920]
MAQSEPPAVNADLAIDQAVGSENIVVDDKDPIPSAEPPKHLLPGVARVEVAAAQLDKPKQWTLFTSILLFGFAYGMDALIRTTFVTYATVDFGNHSLITTVSIVQAVIAAAIQPSVAKLSDAFGRFEMFTFGVFLYTLGTIVEAVTINVAGLAAGAVIAQLGFNIFILSLDIIIADITSLKTRLFFTYLPNLPGLVNTWISGNVTSAVLTNTTWRWGVGMFAIIIPVCAFPLLVLMFLLERKSRKTNPGHRYPSLQSFGKLAWEMDWIGIMLLTSGLALLLTPLTLAGGSSSKWDNASILTPVVLGFLTLVCFIFWERKTPYPLLPNYLLTDQLVWWCILVTILSSAVYVCHVSYLFTLLIVSYDFAIGPATRIASVSGFTNALSSLAVSLLVIKVRHLKGFIIAGIGLALISFGLTYHYRGGTAAQHQHMGVLIALLFTSTNMGAAIGSCISGAIWTQTLYEELSQSLAPFGNSTLVPLIYASPLTVVPEYPVGTPIREAIIESYREIQRVLAITCLAISVPMLAFSLFLRDPRLSDLQTQPEAEEKAAEDGNRRQQSSGTSAWPLWGGEIAGPDSGPEPPFPIKLSGPVIKGFGRGSRELGIPTANIPPQGLANYPDLKSGVYFGFVGLRLAPHTSTSVYPAVLSIGYNPYYKNETRSVEIHILHHFVHYNFYSSPLNLLILGFIRPEYDYESVEALVADIKTDCQVAARSLQRPNWDKWRGDEWLSAFDWALVVTTRR